MKKTGVLMVGFFLLFVLKSHAQDSVAIQLATHIASKMKDTLDLTVQQRNQVYTINMYLHNQKKTERQDYSNTDSLSRRLQRIENKRDSIYHTILPEEKYFLYRQKKRNLVSNN